MAILNNVKPLVMAMGGDEKLGDGLIAAISATTLATRHVIVNWDRILADLGLEEH